MTSMVGTGKASSEDSKEWEKRLMGMGGGGEDGWEPGPEAFTGE